MRQFPAVPIDSARLREEIRKLMHEVADDVAGGGPQDWSSYQRSVGKIEGFALIERLLVDQVEEITTKEDE